MADLIPLLSHLSLCLTQAVADLDHDTREALPMLEQLAHDLANERAAVRLWAEVEKL